MTFCCSIDASERTGEKNSAGILEVDVLSAICTGSVGEEEEGRGIIGDAVSSTESRKLADSSTHALEEARTREADSSVAAKSEDDERRVGPVAVVANPPIAPPIGPSG